MFQASKTSRLRALLFSFVLFGCSDAKCPTGSVEEAGRCVPASSAPCGNQTCSGATPICEESSKTCVGCLQDSDCGDPAAPLCNTTTKTCQAGCSASAACQRFAQAPVCNAATGACVQCTAQERQACGSNVCDAATSTCSTFAQQSANLCQPCVADAQCQPNQLCVPLTFPGASAPYGNYCAANRAMQPNQACTTPYITGAMVTSVDGAQAEVCVSRASTCPALNVDFRVTTCGATNASGDAQCGLSNLEDGVCVPFAATNTLRCSVPCISADDCPNSLAPVCAARASDNRRYCQL